MGSVTPSVPPKSHSVPNKQTNKKTIVRSVGYHIWVVGGGVPDILTIIQAIVIALAPRWNLKARFHWENT